MHKTIYVNHTTLCAAGSPDCMDIEIPKSFTAPQLRAIAAALTGAADKLEPKGAWVEGETTISVARPAAKPRFKVGDWVKIKTTGVNAVVTGFGSYGYYEVKPPSGNALYMHSDDLEPAPEPASEPTSAEVMAEVERAMRKFPTWPTDPLHALAVLGEEFGELTKDVLQFTYEPHKTSRENVRKEAIQTAAMALRFVSSLDVYQYCPCDQHAQSTAAVDARRKMEQQP